MIDLLKHLYLPLSLRVPRTFEVSVYNVFRLIFFQVSPNHMRNHYAFMFNDFNNIKIRIYSHIWKTFKLE